MAEEGARARRLLDDLESVASVLLAIALAHLIGARNVSWAAFSGYMVMRGHVADSVLRGVLRIVGTATGAGLAVALVPAVASSLPLAAVAAGIVGGATLYGALTGRRAYAWLFVGLTFVMVLFDRMRHPELALGTFAVTRLLEVGAGTFACVLVSAASALTLRRAWPAERMPAARRLGWHPRAARHAGQAGAALALMALVARVPWLPQPAQAGVSIMAVMLVPVTSLGTSGLVPVSRKLGQRVAGCLAGSVLAALALVAAQGRAGVLIAATALGVGVGRHLENSGRTYAYVGTQFTLAVLVTLVPDSYADAAIAPALARLGGTLLGLALLEPVLVAWYLLSPGRSGEAQPLGRGDE